MKAVETKTTRGDDFKLKVRKTLKEFGTVAMSSEESAEEDDDTTGVPQQVLVTSAFSWRPKDLEKVMGKLDKAAYEQSTPRSKKQTRKRRRGNKPSEAAKPMVVSETSQWAVV